MRTAESMPKTLDRKRKLMTSRHRFNNRISLILTATTMIMLGILFVLYSETDHESSMKLSLSLSSPSHHDDTSRSIRWLEDLNDDSSNNDDYTQHSCRYIYDEVSDAADLCNYAKTCNDGEGVWAPWVFCSSKMSVYTSFAVLSPIVLIWMFTLFRLLGSTAEDFFSCSLEMFSLKLGLPPRFAGVTLLALGNGAADVSATISAIVSDEENGYKLSLGALTGAAMLVGGVVAGAVILVAGDNGVKCRGALIRDVMALLLTVIMVWVNLSGGDVTRSTTNLFFGFYGFFVCSVLAADIYHRTVVVPRMRAIAAAVAGAEHESIPDRTNVPPPSFFMQVVTSISNYDNSCLTIAATNPSPTNMEQQQISNDMSGGLESLSASQPQTELVAPALQSPVISETPSGANYVVDEEPFVLRGQNGILSDNNITHAPPSSILEVDTADGGGHYTLVEDHVDRVCVGEGSPGIPSYNWTGAFHDGKQEILVELEKLWNEISSNDGNLQLYERFLLLCELPFTVLRKVSHV